MVALECVAGILNLGVFCFIFGPFYYLVFTFSQDFEFRNKQFFFLLCNVEQCGANSRRAHSVFHLLRLPSQGALSEEYVCRLEKVNKPCQNISLSATSVKFQFCMKCKCIDIYLMFGETQRLLLSSHRKNIVNSQERAFLCGVCILSAWAHASIRQAGVKTNADLMQRAEKNRRDTTTCMNCRTETQFGGKEGRIVLRSILLLHLKNDRLQ